MFIVCGRLEVADLLREVPGGLPALPRFVVMMTTPADACDP